MASMSLHVSIESVRDPPWVHLNPLKLLNCDFIADTDLDPYPAFHSTCNVDLDLAPFQVMQIRADPDLQPFLLPHAFVENNPNSYS
jgi:hypothetical protein